MRKLLLLGILIANCQPVKRAPEFPSHLRWLNVSRPLRLHTDLAGRFVLLDFWTYCCINCMHVLPDLKRLEREFPQLAVVGVHSAKFDNEQELENIRAAILRYDIEHPVVVDEGYRVWQMYGVHAWPTFVLISPRGEVLWQSAGEGIYDRLVPRLRELIDLYGKELRLTPLPLRLEKHTMATGLLAFPGKITLVHRPGEATPRLYFTDSNHNRLVGIALNGAVLEVIGSGNEGWKDGSYEEAEFFRPQGLAYDPKSDALYVADTENHLIRRIDLRTQRVETVAGTGKQARRLYAGGQGRHIPLNSPWDVALQDKTLYIAMAGCHQLWRMDIETGRMEVLAGSGYENLIDGPRLVAALAQPSGLTTDPTGRLYFADSETSSIRYVEGEKVQTLVGKGLFDFGYRDGEASQALLQHPIGLCYHEGALYIADTYNHSIRRLDLRTGRVETVAGTGKRGYRDGPALQAQFNEPNDIIYADGFFYITDTNNHLLRRYDPRRQVVETVELFPVEKLAMLPPRRHSLFSEAIPLPALRIPRGKPWRLEITLPAGYELAAEAPHILQVGESVYKINGDLPGLQAQTQALIGLYLCEKGKAKAVCYPLFCAVDLIPDEAISGAVRLQVPSPR